jgi:radical SAM protein with 4Fe4S-binding SPASM domain
MFMSAALFQDGQAFAPAVALREIDINVTNVCNLTCIYCSYASTPGKEEPSLERRIIDALLEDAAAAGTQVVHFSGGEPVIRKDMPQLIAHAAELGFKMRMHSNGALLTKPKLRELWSAGLRQVLVSLDGFAGQHEFHRQRPGLFQRTVAGIENAVSLGFNVRVNAVATTQNVDELSSLLPLVARLGAATFSVFYMIPVGRGRDRRELMVPPGRWRAFIEEMRAASDRHRPDMEITVEKVFSFAEDWGESDFDGGRGDTCLGFLEKCNYVNVLADGGVWPCVCLIDVAPPLGNIHERPLSEILADPDSWSFYRGLRELNEICAACACRGRCRGGSKALSRIATGEWDALDPRCGGDPLAQRFIPICFMQRENIRTGARSGFAERVDDD